jgi:prevent-host-death family protein
MKKIGVFEAKNTLSALLDLDESGEEIIITRHGKPMARLVPPHKAFSREKARAAAGAIRGRAEGAALGGHNIKDLINEGRQ